MLKKGSSEKWPVQLQDMIGTNKMNVSSLLKYFKPLEDFLDQQLVNEKIGWTFKGNAIIFFI